MGLLKKWFTKKSGAEKSYKYIAKVKINPKRTRYFYSLKEYQSYLKNKSATIKSRFKNKKSSLYSKVSDKLKYVRSLVKKTLSSISYKKVKDTKISGKAKTAVKKAIDKISGTIQTVVKQTPKKDNSFDRYETEYNNGADKVEDFQKEIRSTKALKTKEYISTADQDQELTNPFYTITDKSGETYQAYAWTWNCASCSLAYELRRRGYDCEAGAILYADDGPEVSDICYTYGLNETRLENTAIKNVTASNSSDKAKTLENRIVNSCGDGSRGQLCVYWTNGGGHSLVWECNNGTVIVRDCQSNQKYTLTEIMAKCETVYYYRTDNISTDSIKLDDADFYIINREE